MTRSTPSYVGLTPASAGRSRAARGASRKRDTKPEVALRRALHARGLRYRVDVRGLPGRPDNVFPGAKVACFVDGDYWHGRNLDERLARLATGHNAAYWVAKIRTNVDRDRRHDDALAAAGWLVVRLWETDVVQNPVQAACLVEEALAIGSRRVTPEHELSIKAPSRGCP
ncbi:MAG: very short patch repair endonuclease [Deltaproteobacteria bacterium]|nr:very short patch repair endonuclease [Deltaproteobacteria bacterium]